MTAHPRWPNGVKVELGQVGVFAHRHNGLDGFCIGRVWHFSADVVVGSWVNSDNCCSEHGPEDLLGWIWPAAAALIPSDVDVRELSAAELAEVLDVIGVPMPALAVAP